MFIATIFFVVSWIIYAKDLNLPFIFVIFQFCKLLSDTSMFIEQPTKTLWIDFSVFGYTFRFQDWFLANVDGYTGILIIAFYFFYDNKGLPFKKWALIVYGLSMVFVIFVEFTLQIMNSYAVFSTVVCFLFALWMTEVIMNKY